VPLNQGQSGLVNLADLPLASLARVEVYRGFTGFDLSGSAIGGVVNLVTASAEEAGRGRLSATYGSLDTRRYLGSYRMTGVGWKFLTVGTILSTDGNFEFLDDNGTPYADDDDGIAERVNNHLQERELFLKASRTLGPGELVVVDQLMRREQGLPGHGSYQSTTEALTRTHNLLHIGWQKPVGRSLPLALGVGVFSVYETSLFEDRREKQPPAKPDIESRSLSLGTTCRWQLPLADWRQSLRGLIEWRRESFRPEETFTSSVKGQRQSRDSFVATLEDEINVWTGRLRVVPGVRYERCVDRTAPVSRDSFLYLYVRDTADTTIHRDQVLGSVGAVFNLGRGFTLKANHGRYVRMPSLMELFGYLGVVYPSPRLEPERGLNHDVGLSWERLIRSGGFLSLEYVFFDSRTDNLIVWFRRGQGAGAINLDSAHIRGHELSISCRGWWGLSFSGNVTGLDAVNTGPVIYTQGKQLPDRPEIAASGRLTWGRAPVSAFYEFDYIGGNYWNAYNGVAPNSADPARRRRLHGIGVTCSIGATGLECTGEIKNIGDEQVEDVMGFPIPGRSFYVTASYGF